MPKDQGATDEQIYALDTDATSELVPPELTADERKLVARRPRARPRAAASPKR